MLALHWAITLCMAFGVIALVSFAAHSRLMFAVAATGALVGSFLPELLGGMPRTTGGWVDEVELYRNGVAWSTAMGAIVSLTLCFNLRWMVHKRKEPLQ